MKEKEQTYFYGTGKRKTAIAQVRLLPGNGVIIVNGTPYEERFPAIEHQRVILQPLVTTENAGQYNVVVKVEGGGVTGQSGAIAHGISRALLRADERFKPVLSYIRGLGH